MSCEIAALEPSSRSILVNTFRGPGGNLASESFSDKAPGLDELGVSKLGLEGIDEHENSGVVPLAVPGKALVQTISPPD